MANRVLYLHGFASGPNSTKGSFFSRQFQQIGWDVVQPDLNEGDFEGLTLTRQLKLIDRVAREIEPRLVMGSSLGGYLAALYGALYPEQAPALVLMAPAFGFPGRWAERLGEEALLAWREKGSMPVYHYGEGGMRDIGYGLYQVAVMDQVMGTLSRAHQGVAGSLNTVTRTIGVVTAATLRLLPAYRLHERIVREPIDAARSAAPGPPAGGPPDGTP